MSEQVRMLSAYGTFDTHKVVLSNGQQSASPRAGKPYDGITWGEIERLVESPAETPKKRSRFIIPSDYLDHDGRDHAVQRERGRFWGLAIDVDKGNPSVDAVIDAVTDVTRGCRALVYSSPSATVEERRWRVLIPLAEPIEGCDYLDTATALYNAMNDRGIKCDGSLARPGQPVFLPAVAPDRRDAAGKPHFYVSRVLGGPLLRLDDDHPIVVARGSARAKEFLDSPTRRTADADGGAARRHFQATTTVADCLLRYGFVRKSATSKWWKSPLSQSGSFGTIDHGSYWVAFGDWARIHNVGHESAKGNRWGDAFDLFVHFEHRGDTKAAIAATPVPAGLITPSRAEMSFQAAVRRVEEGEERLEAAATALARLYPSDDPRGRRTVLDILAYVNSRSPRPQDQNALIATMTRAVESRKIALAAEEAVPGIQAVDDGSRTVYTPDGLTLSIVSGDPTRYELACAAWRPFGNGGSVSLSAEEWCDPKKSRAAIAAALPGLCLEPYAGWWRRVWEGAGGKPGKKDENGCPPVPGLRAILEREAMAEGRWREETDAAQHRGRDLIQRFFYWLTSLHVGSESDGDDLISALKSIRNKPVRDSESGAFYYRPDTFQRYLEIENVRTDRTDLPMMWRRLKTIAGHPAERRLKDGSRNVPRWYVLTDLQVDKIADHLGMTVGGEVG